MEGILRQKSTTGMLFSFGQGKGRFGGVRVAVIDIGTNSTRLLVAACEEGSVREVLHRDLRTTRLGEGIEERRLRPEAVARTLRVLEEYLERARSFGAERVVAAATSAVRDAANKGEFLRAAREVGLEVEVLSGEEEAYYSYLGACLGLALEPRGLVVVDVGGGSTEFIWEGGGSLFCRSVNAGAVRMTEGGYGEEAIGRVLEPVLRAVRAHAPRHLVGVGGTVTTCAAMVQKLKTYDPSLVHGFTLSLEQVEGLLALLSRTPLEERRRLPGLQPERADIIVAGVRIVRRIMLGLEMKDLQVSETDIMYGLALRAAGGVERKPVIIYQI